MDLKEYFEEHQFILLALSIFLLLTFSLASTPNSLNNVLGVLSASISYILLLALVDPKNIKKSSSFLLGMFLGLLTFFTITFCIWIMLNIIITLSSNVTLLLILFLILMAVPGIRLLIGR